MSKECIHFFGPLCSVNDLTSRSQWPRGLKRWTAATRLLGLRARTPPGKHGRVSVVSVVCCQGEVSASS